MGEAGARRRIRIGGASGFWGDSAVGAPQLVKGGAIDFLVFDYLAETTMAILASARSRRPDQGYATDFVDVTLREVLPEVMRQGIRVIANAGGIHPMACAEAVRVLAGELGLSPRVAVVTGDDVMPLVPALVGEGVTEMASGDPLPKEVLSANAYLGALPIAAALDQGADIVITGRCVDSAVTLGALMHAFGWRSDHYDALAAGSLAGHLIECGCQATGGLFTDWQRVPGWADIGYPVIECDPDGSFTLTKPPGTGGLIDPACVAEQLLYEIGDPGAYLLPDVTCDFRGVRIERVDADHVRVTGARGRPPGRHYKVTATWRDGWRCAGSLVIVGFDAAAKARRTGEAIVGRTRAMLRQRGLGDYTHTAIELLGCEHLYGPYGRVAGAREVMLRVVVDHPDPKALALFAREIAPAGTSWAPGTTMPAGGRPTPSPLVKPFAFLIDKSRLVPQVHMNGLSTDVAVPGGQSDPAPAAPLPEPPAWVDPPGEALERVPLIRLAHGRSGDKGDLANIGLVARRPQWWPLLWNRVTVERVRQQLAHLLCAAPSGPITRHALPGLHAMNVLVPGALAGGGPASPRFDPLGKGLAQIVLAMEVEVPESVARRL
jgi:hypothetical protein